MKNPFIPFEKPEWWAEGLISAIERGGQIPKTERARIHELTRTVRISDEELDAMTCILASPRSMRDALPLLIDLRDRYEGLGKYAPAQPAAAPQPEPASK